MEPDALITNPVINLPPQKNKISKVFTIFLILIILAGIASWTAMFLQPQKVEEKSTTTADNWKTYRNEKYGFEVSLPDGWLVNANVTSCIDGCSIEFISPATQQGTKRNEIACNGGGGSCIPEWLGLDIDFADFSRSDKYSKISSTTINNKEWIKYDRGDLFYFTYFDITKDGKTYSFGSPSATETSVMRQILSTFKFVSN